jgi:hypothetical protein
VRTGAEAASRRRTSPVVAIAFSAIYVVSALTLARAAARDTHPLADHRTYVRGSAALYRDGDPYSANEGVFFEYHYRYPPLLAVAMPALRWIWFPLIVGGIAVALARRHADGGTMALAFPIQFGSLLVENAFNGNAQGLVLGVGALVPTGSPVVAALVAVTAWIKLYPACIVVWWLGRRDTRSLRWFAGTFVALGLVQAPWLGDFLRYSATQTGIPSQLSLRSLGVPIWVCAIAVATTVTYVRARRGGGWLACVVLQIVVLPRVMLATLPLLLMHPSVLTAPYETFIGQLPRREVFLGIVAVGVVAVTTASIVLR